jgi:hypothetical protein
VTGRVSRREAGFEFHTSQFQDLSLIEIDRWFKTGIDFKTEHRPIPPERQSIGSLECKDTTRGIQSSNHPSKSALDLIYEACLFQRSKFDRFVAWILESVQLGHSIYQSSPDLRKG